MLIVSNKESKKSFSSSGSIERSGSKASTSIKKKNRNAKPDEIKASFEKSKENIAESKFENLVKNLNTAPIPNKEKQDTQSLVKKQTLNGESFENSFKKQLVTDIYHMMENSRDESWVSPIN